MGKKAAVLSTIAGVLVFVSGALAFGTSYGSASGAVLGLEVPAISMTALTPEPSPDPTPIPTPEPTPEAPATATLSFTGDLMAHSWQYENAYNAASGAYDFNYNFEYVAEYLQAADLTIGNLETVLAGGAPKDYPRFNTPDAFADALKNAGFDLLSTANNHSNDQGEAGILRTLEALDGVGLEHFGTYASAEDRDGVLVKDVNGITFAFLSYTYSTNGLPLTSGKPYLVNALDRDLITADIARARALEPDFIIVMPHMGVEYATSPSDTYIEWARFMLEVGADIVIASHPHVLQRVETVTLEEEGGERMGFIAYSMGNFISSQRTVPRDAGMILNMAFEKEEEGEAALCGISYIPTWVKFINSSNAYEIQVLSLHDALADVSGDNTMGIRSKDISRLKDIYAETAAMFLGGSLALDDIQNEYILYAR